MKKVITTILISLSIISSIAYLIFNIQNSVNVVDGLGPIITSAIIAVFAITLGAISLLVIKDKGQLAVALASIFITVLTAFNLLNAANIIILPEKETLEDFTNIEITEAMNWASGNGIEITQTYEYSDTVPKYHIIKQNITEGTMTKEIESIEFVISNGPNYDKQIIVPNMLGWEIDEIINFIEQNHLNNVVMNYKANDIERDIVIAQDKSGTLRRSDKITMTVSLGSKEDLQSVPLPDLTNQSLFESTLWLKRNGINYKLEYIFDDTVERHTVISQNIDSDTTVSPFKETIILTVSKGEEIIVPNILEMTVEEVTKWVIDNKLQIDFSDKYDDTIEIGKIISSNRNVGDKLQQEDEITIATSKGPLRMEDFSSLSDFRNWASQYNISYEEEYEFNNDIKSGGIISFSKQDGDIIGNKETIHIKVSQGSPVTIPNFYCKRWSSIKSTCNSIGLKCYYKTGTYNSGIKKDYAYSQSRKSGSTVVQGTSLTVTLSKGSPQTFTIYLPESYYIGSGGYTNTVNNLKPYLSNSYPGVTFKFLAKPTNELKASGMPHDDSPTKTGDSIKQGNTYEIWIVQ